VVVKDGGDVSMGFNLNVDGVTTLNGKLITNSDISANSTMNVKGATTLENTLGVTGATTLSSSLGVAGAVRTNFKRYEAFTVDLSTLDGTGTAFATGDVLAKLGTLDVANATGITGTRIIIEKVIVNVSTAAGTALNARLDLSTDTATAANAAMANNTEVVGAGATYAAGGSTAADLDLNSATCTIITPNSQAAVANSTLYLVSETALAANVTTGTVNIAVEYSVM